MNLLISDGDAFKVWCIFNFLSEDKYPLHIVVEEVGPYTFNLSTDTDSTCTDMEIMTYFCIVTA